MLFRWVSAVAASSDRNGVAAAGADGLRVRVVGDGDAVVPQLADQARDLSGGGDLHGADVVLSLVPGEDDGQGGQVRLPISMTNRQYRRCRVTAQSTWKKSAASMVAACACRNWRQVVLVCRFGAGGIFRALRTRRIVDAPTRWPSLSSPPWILLYLWGSEIRFGVLTCVSAMSAVRRRPDTRE